MTPTTTLHTETLEAVLKLVKIAVRQGRMGYINDKEMWGLEKSLALLAAALAQKDSPAIGAQELSPARTETDRGPDSQPVSDAERAGALEWIVRRRDHFIQEAEKTQLPSKEMTQILGTFETVRRALSTHADTELLRAADAVFLAKSILGSIIQATKSGRMNDPEFSIDGGPMRRVSDLAIEARLALSGIASAQAKPVTAAAPDRQE